MKKTELKFIDSWKQDRPWLHHNVEQNVRSATGASKPMDQKSNIYTKDYKIGIFCFSVKYAALRRKSKDWLALNQYNVSKWDDNLTLCP
jgi:hypothetical protein